MALVAGAACVALAADQLVTPERALAWQPKEYPEAVLFPSIEFLEPKREWERMDVWVPKEPADERLPCVVAVFGGGYGDKMGGFVNDARPLLERGFVIAAPDYALQTDAPVPLCSWDVANAPEMLPHGGAIANPAQVRLLTVHPEGTIYFTLDGSEPDGSSSRYAGPVTVAPGQTLRAIIVREGLKPSRATTGVFESGPQQPVITTTECVMAAQLGKPFRCELEADFASGASWYVGGKTGDHFREYGGGGSIHRDTSPGSRSTSRRAC